jgi:HEAT repeat protein
MGFFDTVARLTITEVFKAGLAEVNSRLNPDEMIMLLQQAEVDADAAQPELGGLFRRIDRDGANGDRKFLKFFQSGLVQNELHKPFQNRGKPDVNILIEAFKRSASEHPESENYLSDLMPLWMEAFVESYFDRVGICFQVAKAQYLKQLARRVNDVKFVGIAVPGEEVEKQEVLAQIFVMPDVREERSRNSPQLSIEEQTLQLHKWLARPNSQSYTVNVKGQQDSLLEEQKEWAMRDRSAPRIPAQKVINLAQRKAVVLGAPGSGKTMLASYFALMLCETAQSDPSQISLKAEDDYLPVVVRIRDWILESKMGLLEYLRSNAEASLACKELPTGFFEHWLERGRALILLDGLDEVVDEAQRRKVAEQIETFLHQYQDNPAVITSRPAGYRWDFFNLDEFPHYTLESFDDKQVATFIDHWYDSRLKEDPAQADRRKADLQKAFARNERIRLLAKNPLLLTIITLIHRYQAELPRQRCKLYEKAVETLLTSWDSGKEIKLYSQVLLFLKSDDLLYILKKLAYWIHTQGSTGETEGGTLIDRDELIRWLRKEIQTLKKCEAHEAKGEAERFIDFIQRRTGLLNEQGRDRYAFVHKTFQEYLTAEEIFDRADVEDDTEIILAHFRQHLHDQHWREVLLLLVSKLKGKKAQKAIQAVLDAESEYEQWLHRDLLFAGWCLTEDPPELVVVAADWVGEILDRLVGLEVSDFDRIGWKVRGEVEKILHCLGETTLEKVSLEKLQAQGNRIDRFRLLEFQAALGQESEASDILKELLQDKDSAIKERAIFSCYKFNSLEFFSSVVNLLDDNNIVSFKASSFLRYCGDKNSELVKEILPMLQDKNPNVRSQLVRVLGQLENPTSEVINSLVLMLHDNDSNVRCHAIESFGRINNFRENITSDLLPLLNNENSKIRSYVLDVLIQLGNNSSEVINTAISLLSDRDSYISHFAAHRLGRLANNSQEVLELLLSLAQNQNVQARRLSMSALSYYRYSDDADKKVLNVIFSLLKDPDNNIRGNAIFSLSHREDIDIEIIEKVLLPLLQDEDCQVQYNTANALLYRSGKNSLSAQNVMISFIEGTEENFRVQSAQVLRNLNSPMPEIINLWLSLLEDRDVNMRSVASSALSQLAKTSDTICPEVLKWLDQNPNHDRIGNAIDCLWSIVVE